MTITCQICGLTIEPGLLFKLAYGLDPIQFGLLQFDHLADLMNMHLSQKHEQQNYQAMLFAHLSAKIYAMTWADSAEQTFDLLRESWRIAALEKLSAAGQDRIQAAAPAAGAASAADPPPVAS
jgi:hypothetical protein